MDKVVHGIITAFRDEQQKLLESIGDLPKSDPFEHGMQVGLYRGIKSALEIIEAVLNDEAGRDAQI